MADPIEVRGGHHCWRSEWKSNRLRLSPWMLDCLSLEFDENLHAIHEECECLCRRCYQLTWLRKPQHCKCGAWKKGRYLGLDDRVRARRRMCRCNPRKRVKWGAWFCHGCMEVCKMTVSAPCVCKRDAADAVLDNLEERMAAGYTTSESKDDVDSESTSYRPSTKYYSSKEEVDSSL